MKSIFKVLCVVLALSFSFSANAQKAAKPFVGSIKMSISYQDLPAEYEGQVPSEFVYYFSKDGKFKTDIVSPLYTIGTVINPDGSTVFLYDMMGQKMAYKSPAKELEDKVAEVESKEENEPKINDTGETKVIAGFTCKKYEVTDENGEITEIFATEEIVMPASFDKASVNNKGIKGFPMQFSAKQGEWTMTCTVTQVKKGGVNNSMFVISDDYTELSQEQFEGMMKGQM